MFNSKENQFLSNEKIYKYLDNIITNKSFANGYIFYGAEGLGKKNTALKFIQKIFKQYSLVSNIESKITNNNHPDFLVIEPSSSSETKSSDTGKTKKTGTEIIKIGQIRNIKTFLGQKSVESEKKVVLIVDAHLLNEAASNCLLKTLEEPCNGIFILLTSKLNLLLDTIISRCQLVRFRSFSVKQIEVFINEYLNFSNLDVINKLNYEVLINSANGSPGQFLKNLEIWNELSDEITCKLHTPLKNSLDILEISKLISEQLEIYQQICLINFIQLVWWKKTHNRDLIRELEKLKLYLKRNVQPRLAWEVTFFKISMKE